MLVNDDGGFAGVTQHFHHFAADRAETGDDNRAGAANGRSKPLDLHAIGLSADRHQNCPWFDPGIHVLNGAKLTTAPLANDGHTVTLA